MDLELLKYQIMYQKQSKTQVKLNDKQNKAYSLMTQGKSIFLTGKAGSGKTKCLQMFIETYKHSKNMGITSTTGISALLFGGTTLHSYLGIGLGTQSVDTLLEKIFKFGWLLKRWKSLEILIIDEVSMLSPELFDKLEELSRLVRHDERPFGGVQLILSGDFCQLPVVKSDKFCFESKKWNKCIQDTIYLTDIIRQTDPEFQECLNNVRLGLTPKKTRILLKSRLNAKLVNEHGIKPTKLYSTNSSVEHINNKELDILAESDPDFYEYVMEIDVSSKVKPYVIEKNVKNCSALDKLQLCVGVQVMLIMNMDIDNGLVNGSRGVVTRFVDDIPIVKFLNGEERTIDYYTWEIEENNRKVMSITQIPLKIAYALTIHRSQGCSLDYAEVDLSNCFEYGQAYVALSRVRNIKGISILGLDFDKISAHPKAIEFYRDL